MADLFIVVFIILLALYGTQVAADVSSDQPSPELLEFLGEWETKDGEWFNPMWILKNLTAKNPQNKPLNKETDDEN